MILDSAVDRSEARLTMLLLMRLCTTTVFTHWVKRYRAQSASAFAVSGVGRKFQIRPNRVKIERKRRNSGSISSFCE